MLSNCFIGIYDKRFKKFDNDKAAVFSETDLQDFLIEVL